MGDESDILKRPAILTAYFSWLAVSDQGAGLETCPLFFMPMERKSRFYLERALREFIRSGVNAYLGDGVLPESSVIMAKDNIKSPSGLYATLEYVGETRSNPHHSSRQFEEEEDDLDFSDQQPITYIQQAVHTRYMLIFYRITEGIASQFTAHDAAQAFVDFADSHFGIACASNTVIDGTLSNVYVYQTNGDNTADARFTPETFNSNPAIHTITLFNPEHEGSEEHAAKIRLYVSTNGKIESGWITKKGKAFSTLDRLAFASGNPIDLSKNDAIVGAKIEGSIYPTVAPAGKGFVIDRPLQIETIDQMRPDQKFEERSGIEMDISFVEERVDKHSYRIRQRYPMDGSVIDEFGKYTG